MKCDYRYYAAATLTTCTKEATHFHLCRAYAFGGMNIKTRCEEHKLTHAPLKYCTTYLSYEEAQVTMVKRKL